MEQEFRIQRLQVEHVKTKYMNLQKEINIWNACQSKQRKIKETWRKILKHNVRYNYLMTTDRVDQSAKIYVVMTRYFGEKINGKEWLTSSLWAKWRITCDVDGQSS